MFTLKLNTLSENGPCVLRGNQYTEDGPLLQCTGPRIRPVLGDGVHNFAEKCIKTLSCLVKQT